MECRTFWTVSTAVPVTLMVNHALADGRHIAAFFDALKCELKKLTEL